MSLNNISLPDLSELSDSIYEWLMSVMDPSAPGLFKMCQRGSFVLPDAHCGLGPSCMAMKTAYTVNILDRFSREQRDSWVDYINSFQLRKGKFNTLYEDTGMMDAVYSGGLLKRIRKQKQQRDKALCVRRAETRQACAALMCAGGKSWNPIDVLGFSRGSARDYFCSLDWTRPWHSGSQLSHLIFLLKYNAEIFGLIEDYENAMPLILEELDNIHDSKSGCWFKGDPSVLEKINGAMKVLTAYKLIDKAPEEPERLVDICLQADEENDGCNVLDLLLVLHYCVQYTPYRRKEINELAKEKLMIIMRCKQDDGAFSFSEDGSQTSYLGLPVSDGLMESDIHGTHLFTWAICLIMDLLNPGLQHEWKIPIT